MIAEFYLDIRECYMLDKAINLGLNSEGYNHSLSLQKRDR